MLTCPVNVCVVSVQTADFNGICSAFARRQSAAQGMGDKRRQKIPRRTAGRELRLVHDRVVAVGETEKKIHFNSFSLKDERKKKKKTFRFTYLPSPSGEPCWPRYFQSPLSECESRAVAIHFTQRKKTVFLIKRADDGQAAARARGERGTGA